MKKSQILAALALAFALGVVAPVAGTYAKVVGSGSINTIDEAKMKVLRDQMLNTDKAFNELEYAQEYINLYEDLYADFNGDGKGIIENLEFALDDTKDGYNGNTQINRTAINGYIKTINDNLNAGDNLYERQNDAQGVLRYVNLNGTPTTLGQAKLRDLGTLERVNTFKEAYDAIKALYDNATENIQILTLNYDGTKAAVKTVNAELGKIQQACSAWLKAVAAYFNGATVTGYINTIVGDINAINKDIAKNLQLSEAWLDANDTHATISTNIGNGVKLQLALDTAKALSKFGVTGQLYEAQVNYNKINDPTQAVDYTEAIAYIGAMNNAITTFKTGKAPVTTPDEGNTQPGTNVPNPGNTGIVGSAEGTAATTVSIVAGLATALTALGAGVVAYRSARREK